MMKMQLKKVDYQRTDNGVTVLCDLYNSHGTLYQIDLKDHIKEQYGLKRIYKKTVNRFFVDVSKGRLNIIFDEETLKIEIVVIGSLNHLENEFDSVEKRNLNTGTRYDEEGYDSQGLDYGGFDRWGIHYETQTKWDPEGYTQDGEYDESKAGYIYAGEQGGKRPFL